MHIASAIFDRSAACLEDCPDESLPEFAFIGRSNVGKSSLLNMLAGKERLARVSPTPGFTKLINFFTINKVWRLVDLPGYGFAEGSRKKTMQFNRAVSFYLQKRPNLCCIFLLIDSGLLPQPIDLEFLEWLTTHRLPFVIVFTKTDRGNEAEVETNITAFTEKIGAWFAQLPEMFRCSSNTGTGRTELLKLIEATVVAGSVEEEPVEPTVAAEAALPIEEEAPKKLSVRAGQERDPQGFSKRQLKSKRPW